MTWGLQGIGDLQTRAYYDSQRIRAAGAERSISGKLRAAAPAVDFGATRVWAEVYLSGAG